MNKARRMLTGITIKNAILPVFYIVISIILSGCGTSVTSFEQIKRFKPEDKYFSASLKSLHFIIETSEISRIDSVFTLLVKENNLPVSAEGCKDGFYVGESLYDAFDYKHIVKLRIQNEKIISVDYDEIAIDGHGKQHDKKYCEEMSVTGTTPAIAYPKYELGLLENQNIYEIDAVTGATYSLYRFRYAVMISLIKASL